MQKYLIAFIFIFYTTISHARIRFSPESIGFAPPALSFIYYYIFFLPWILIVVLTLETIVLYYLQRKITVKRVISVVFISNIVSAILGIIIISLISAFFSFSGVPSHGQAFLYMGMTYLGVPIAYILSILIEYIVLRLIKNIDKPFLYSLLMNTASYGFIVALYYISFKFKIHLF
jgi:hypothetical protein